MDLSDPTGVGPSPERSYRESRALFEKVEILFLLAAVLGCVVTLIHVALLAPLPYQLDFGEGPMLGVAVRVAQGLGAYPPATQLPYVFSPYGPLPYYLGGLCVKLFGVSFTAPRLLVVGSGIWCAVLIALKGGNNNDDLILQGFVQEYGPTVIAAPTTTGFNRVAWVMPFVALALGIAFVVYVVRSWKNRPAPALADGIVIPRGNEDDLDEFRQKARKETDL